jgi:hypothetical protein
VKEFSIESLEGFMQVRSHCKAKKNGGQAIVMVTLALIAMAGMMGLAVDLGWSYFVQKQAQAAADSGALAAVQEAYRRLGGVVSSVTCTTGGNTDCVTNLPCSSISSGNLYSGCLYAAQNGFTSGGLNSRQQVTITSGNTTPIPTVPDVTDVRYWVTVRTVQTIPQLFSAVLGNSQGTVSAIATAAVAAQIVPGSFYGMNREGDCLTTSTGAKFNCGIDIDIGGANGTCAGGLGSGKVCAPAGLFMASSCNGTSVVGCGATTTSTNGYAGTVSNGQPDVVSGSTIVIAGSGAVNPSGNFKPGTTNGAVTDPTNGIPQPPLLAPNSALPTCGVPASGIPSGATVGPYQYYTYTTDKNGNRTPTGAPILIDKNTNVTFTTSTANTCNFAGAVFTAGATQVNGTFPTYIFWGGLNISGNANTSVSFAAGQYVMAGTTTQTNGLVLNMEKSSITGNSAAGTQFILTDGSYDGALATQKSATALTGMPTLYQGATELKNSDVTLTGPTNSAPSTLTAQHKNFLFWQDRRNSTDNINTSNGNFISHNPPSSNNVTNTSPEFILDNGNNSMTLTGVYYQPRGAWISYLSGGASVNNSPLQVITGALDCVGGCGNTALTLIGPTAPTIKYIASLIQ